MSAAADDDGVELLQRALQAYRLDPGLALHRATEAALTRRVRLDTPLLELGCHDGTFGALALDGRVAVADRIGCDLDTDGFSLARNRYRQLVAADGTRLPWRDASFGSAVCNSVLTHVDDLPACLAELRRVLRPGGRLVASVPTPRFHPAFAPARCLRALGLRARAEKLSRDYDARWHQRHFLDRSGWESALAAAGLRLERWDEYFDGAGSWAWSAWFVAWRAGPGRVNLGALARRLLPAGSSRTRRIEGHLARRLAPHMRPVADGAGGSALWVAVRTG